MWSSPWASDGMAARRRSIRANGSDSPHSSRVGHEIDGQWAIRAACPLGPPGAWSGYEKQTSPRYVWPAAARLATRPPYEWPPTTVHGPGGAIARRAGTASSALRFGRSIATASTPRARRPATNGAIEEASPDAPWPRNTRGDRAVGELIGAG